MSDAYSPAGWAVFAGTSATAAAALAGFLFIAVSINLREILDGPSLPGRTAATLILLATPLVTSLLMLVPGQGRIALGLELLAAGLAIGAIERIIDHRTPRSDAETTLTWVIGRLLPSLVTCGCLVLAGATVLGRAGGGLYWMVPSVLAAFAFGLLNIWVLVIEILR